MYFVGNNEFNSIENAMHFRINKEFDIKDEYGNSVQHNVFYTNCKCDNKCPNTCFHKEYEAWHTVCYYDFTCECMCGCPNENNSKECSCCGEKLCSDCYESINDNFGLCKSCISNDFKDNLRYPFTQEQFKFLKDFYIINPKEEPFIRFLENYPEIFH